MIRGVHHVALSTGDLDRMVEIYRDVMGFEQAYESGWSDRPIVGLENSSARNVMLRAGNAYIEIFEYSSPVGKPVDPNRPACDHGYTHFCLDVKDIDSEYERLVAAGMRFHCPPPPRDELGSGTIRATYGRDPDDNIIELQEILDADVSTSLENTEMIGTGPVR